MLNAPSRLSQQSLHPDKVNGPLWFDIGPSVNIFVRSTWQGYFMGPWRNWSKVPEEKKQRWWQTFVAAEPARKKSKTAVACRKSDHVKQNVGPMVSSGSPPYIELMRRTHTCKDGTYVDYCCRPLVGWSRLNSSIFGNMEGSPYRKFSFSRRKGAVAGTGPRILHSGDLGRLLAGTQRPVSCLGGITCALKSTEVAHSQQAFPRQDIAPVILLSRVPLRLEPHSESGEDRFPDNRPGSEYLSMMHKGMSGCFEGYYGRLFFWSADFRLRKVNPELLVLPSSLVGGRPRPRHLFTDPFSSPIPSWGDVPEADSKAVLMAPLRRRRSCFFDDGPRTEIREGDLADMRRKYAIHPSVGMRSPSEFERAPDGGANEIAIYEAYLEAVFWGVIPSLIGEESSFFGFCFSQLTPLTWRTLMVIQSRNLRGVLGATIPSEMAGTIDVSRPGFLCWRSSSEVYNGSSLVISMGDFPGNVVRLLVSAIYDEHQKAKTRKRRPFYTPPPRLARATLLVNGLSSTSSTGVEVVLNHDPLGDAHRRLFGEVFFLRSQVQNMMARRDLLIQQVKASARWELMKELLEKRVEHWDLEEDYHRHLFLSGGIDQQSGSFSRVATPRSVVGSRFSEEPSF
ncbi:hypothetical protein F2Q69_00035314 [Brassica cretica]|uniref:Uncharacterized protein n=1 Tax=Brassica cretica TaxID=69181 RepID=A0A8S9SLZ9_BRACR|nr:hypothetical protein F2Q69_00035314 [Brassica cretica]